MKKYALNEITTSQFIFFIYKTQVGMGILTMPRITAEEAGTDGWISVIFGYFLAIFISIVIIKIMEKHPEDTLFDLLSKVFGKWIGKLFIIGWIGYTGYFAIVLLLTTVFIIQVWIFPQTPSFLVMWLFLIPIYMITRSGIRVIGRYAEFVYFITLWMVPLLLFGLKDAHWLNLLPILKEDWKPVLVAVQKTVVPFIGFELAFILYPFLKNKKSAFKGIIIANTLTFLLYMYVIIITYVYFSPDEIKEYTWPTLNILKSIELPFLERFEIIFLSFYMIILSMTIIPFLFTAAFGTSKLFGQKSHKIHVRIYIGVIAFFSIFYTPIGQNMETLGKWADYLGIGFGYAFPIFFGLYVFIYTKLKNRGLSA